MSYILDALRKSEQQRQAVQPDTVTDRLLANPQTPQHKPKRWMMAMLIGNLLAIVGLAWHFSQNSSTESRVDSVTASNKATTPVPVIAQDKTTQNLKPTTQKQQEIDSQPSIAQLVEANKTPPELSAKPVQNKELQAKKPPAIKKELPARNPANLPLPNVDLPEEPPKTMAAQPVKPAAKKGLPDLNDLPAETRNGLPNLTINVFSYASEPEDRFVIIDMVKYRSGQLIKGTATLKEIRPDGIIVQYGNETFRVERP